MVVRRMPRVFRLAAIVLSAAFCHAESAAENLTLQHLAGFWLSVDEALPEMWREGTIVPLEEVLVITPSGIVENRFVPFWIADGPTCRDLQICSDFPLLQSGKIEVTGDLVTFTSVARQEIVEGQDRNEIVRESSVPAFPSWFARLSADDRILRLDRADGSGTTRIFARTEQLRLARLRAGFLDFGESATQQWRCFLSHATAGEPAFAAFGRNAADLPQSFDGFLRAASYLLALQNAAARPTADDTDPEIAAMASLPLQSMLVESFDDVRLPATVSDKRHLLARVRFIGFRAHGMGVEEAASQAGADGQDLPIGISEEEIAALARARGGDPKYRAMISCETSVPR